MAQHLVYNDGPDAFVCEDGTQWPVGEGRVVDTLDPWIGPQITANRLNDRGRPPAPPQEPPLSAPAEEAEPAPKLKGTR